MIPRVVDLSHHNTGTLPGGDPDFEAMRTAGIWGVILKATQGIAYRDPLYQRRRIKAENCGLLVGAYHFNTGDAVKSQVEHFLNYAKPGLNTCLVLDYEDNRLSNMGIHQAVEFLHELERKIGRRAAIYSGNRLKEGIGKLTADERYYLCRHRLWLAQYGPKAVLPIGFEKYWLWQFTGDGIGPEPHSIPGIRDHGVDLNTFDGSREDLEATWI